MTARAASRARLCMLAALAAAPFVATLAPHRASAQIERKKLNPCTLVTNVDVLRVLGWSVEHRERKPYDIHGATGAMCFLAASQGQVIVIAPDPESEFPGITVYNDPNAGDFQKHLYGLGADVRLYNGTVYVSGYHRDVAVRVVPDTHAASYDEVEGFAKVIVRALSRARHANLKTT